MNSAAETFNGFAAESLVFLRELKANNSKVWFEAHRSDYEQHLLAPLRALTAGLTPLMLSIDADFVTTPARVISRIHRDTRFARDKSPYKSTLWLTFKRPLSDWQDAPAFFFELGADTWRYGMGFYAASKETMDRLRQTIERKPDEFEEMLAFLAGQDRFDVEGEQYKRVINPAVPEHLRPWHQRKSVYLVCNRQSDVGRKKWTPKSGKNNGWRCQDEKGSERALHERVSRRSSEVGNRGRIYRLRGIASTRLAEINVRELGAG